MEEVISRQVDSSTSDKASISLDSKLEELPQAELLGGDHGREKAAVMRRNIAGRKKPTRQGLRDSLLKSLDESELQNILVGGSIEEEAKAAQPVAPISPSSPKEQTTAHVVSTPLSPVKTSQTNNFNNDLLNVLKRRESKRSTEPNVKAIGQEGDKPSNQSDIVDMIATDDLKSPPVDRSSKPKSFKSAPVEDMRDEAFNMQRCRESKKSSDWNSKMVRQGGGEPSVKHGRQGGGEPSVKHVRQAADSNKDMTDMNMTEDLKSPPVDRSSKPKSFKSAAMEDLGNGSSNRVWRREAGEPREWDSKVIGQGGGDSSIQYTKRAVNTNKDMTDMSMTEDIKSPPVDRSSKPKAAQGTISAHSTGCSGSNTSKQEASSGDEYNTRTSFPFIRPRLRPVTIHEEHQRVPHIVEEPAVPWREHLNNEQAKLARNPTLKDDVTVLPSWPVKLRKVVHPLRQAAATEEHRPVLPSKPKLRPVSLGANSHHKQSDTSLVATQEGSFSQPLHVSPVNSSSVSKNDRQMLGSPPLSVEKSSQPTPNHLEIQQTKPPFLKPVENSPRFVVENSRAAEERSKPVRKSPKMRRPVTRSETQPEWIRQAAERHKRASLLIEQADALANTSKDDSEVNAKATSDQTVDPFVKLRFAGKSSRSSSIESSSTTNSEQSDTTVPAWKLELNQQNRSRHLERHKKARSAVEPSVSSLAAEKENWKDYSIPSWKKELRSIPKGPTIDVKESSDAEPEFMRLFNKRQDRLRKTGSVLVEAD